MDSKIQISGHVCNVAWYPLMARKKKIVKWTEDGWQVKTNKQTKRNKLSQKRGLALS